MPLGMGYASAQATLCYMGTQLPLKKAQHPHFSVHVYCGHGRPSQLLLSSCYNTQETQTQKMMDQNFEIRIL